MNIIIIVYKIYLYRIYIIVHIVLYYMYKYSYTKDLFAIFTFFGIHFLYVSIHCAYAHQPIYAVYSTQ